MPGDCIIGVPRKERVQKLVIGTMKVGLRGIYRDLLERTDNFIRPRHSRFSRGLETYNMLGGDVKEDSTRLPRAGCGPVKSGFL